MSAPSQSTRSVGDGPKLDVIWLGLLLLLVLLPIPFGSYRPWAWSAMALASSVLMIGWAVRAALGRKALVWRGALAIPAIAVMLVVAWIIASILPNTGLANPIWQLASETLGRPLQGRIALSADAALIGLMRLLAYLSIFWLSLQYTRDQRRAEMLLVWMSWIGLALAIYGLINFFAGNAYLLWFERWAGNEDVTATFVNRNHYATYAGLGLLCSAAVGMTTFRSAWQLSDRSQPTLPRTIECLVGRPLVYFVIMLAIGMAWLQSHSRMGAAATVAGLLVMLLLMMATRLVRRRIVPWVAGVLILLFLFLVSGGATLERLQGTSEINRMPIFSIVTDQIASAPVTGSGYGSFPQAFLIYRDARLTSAYFFTEAHNSYLEMAAEWGIPAAMLFVLAIFWCFCLCLIGAFRRQRAQIYPIVAAAATVLVGIHALMDFSMQIPAVVALYAVLLGAGVAQSWTIDPSKSKSRSEPTGRQPRSSD